MNSLAWICGSLKEIILTDGFWWVQCNMYYITKGWYNVYLSPHIKETGCVHEHLVIHVQLFWSGVYVKLWLTPSRCSCWQSCAAAVLDTRIFSLCLGPVSHIYRAGRANTLNCWPPFILGLSRKRCSSLERQCACTREGEMSGGGRIPEWQWVQFGVWNWRV